MASSQEMTIRDLLQIASHATASVDLGDFAATTKNQTRPDKDTLALVQGVRFTRAFVPSYNIVLVVVLLAFAFNHWIGYLIRSTSTISRVSAQDVTAHQRENRSAVAKTPKHASSDSSSSSSSTVDTQSDSTLVHKHGEDLYEDTPLLRKQDGSKPRRTLLSPVRSWLMYQPPNLPVFNKNLPSNACTVLILTFLGLNAFYLFYRMVYNKYTPFIFADRAGYLFAVNLPFLYLSAAKNGPFRPFTGHSYEGLNILHRRTGELLCLFALLHAIGMTISWYDLLRPAGISFWHYLTIHFIWKGAVAFLSYELLYLTSLSSFRQRFYEVFLAFHILLQFTALVFLYLHYPTAKPYVLASLIIILLDRVIFRAGIKRRTMTADLTILDDGETVMVSADWNSSPQHWYTRLLPSGIISGWAPTEHIFLSIPAISTPNFFQAHPFTIASAAPSAGDHAWLSLIIRSHTGFSAQLLTYAQSHSRATVRIDGPYGSLSALQMLHNSFLAVVVAGGSGLAVAYPVLWSLLHSPEKESRRVVFIWVVHSESHIQWLGTERIEELKTLGAEVVIPPPTARAGRPDVDALVRDVVLRHGSGQRVGAMVSGPDGLNRGVRNACSGLVGEGWDVSVKVEKFGW